MNEPDLNLLRIFDTLFEVRSATQAADRLGLTQSAVSHALKRLRQAFDDPLFVRSAGGLRPTARAEEIAPRVRQGMAHLRSALAPSLFDPAVAERRFRIAASGYFCLLLIPRLIAETRRAAPGIAIDVVPSTEALVAALDLGEVDVALGIPSRAPSRLVEDILYQEQMVWVAAQGHPALDRPFDPAVWSALPRVNLTARRPFEAVPPTLSERLHDEAGRTDPTVYDSTTAIAIAARTAFVALVPKRIAMLSAEPIIIVEPDDPGMFGVTMMWHARHRDDAGLAWLRAIIRRVC